MSSGHTTAASDAVCVCVCVFPPQSLLLPLLLLLLLLLVSETGDVNLPCLCWRKRGGLYFFLYFYFFANCMNQGSPEWARPLQSVRSFPPIHAATLFHRGCIRVACVSVCVFFFFFLFLSSFSWKSHPLTILTHVKRLHMSSLNNHSHNK